MQSPNGCSGTNLSSQGWDRLRKWPATGLLHKGGDARQLAIAGRAIAYGLARMRVHAQFPSWGLDEAKALAECEAILDTFIASIAR